MCSSHSDDDTGGLSGQPKTQPNHHMSDSLIVFSWGRSDNAKADAKKKRLISCLIIAPRAAPCLPPAHASHRPERTPPVWPRAGAREGEGERG